MIEQIKKLEKISRQLEPERESRKQAREKVVNYSETFLDNIHSIKAYNSKEGDPKALLHQPFTEEPADTGLLLDLVKKSVDTPGLNPASGGHLGYIPGGGIYYSALGDYLADVTNRYAGVAFAGPGAVEMENMLIQWMAAMVGYPATVGGNLTSGGSIANLTAIVTAREASGLRAKEYEKTVIYLSEQSHHSLDKAIRIAGLNESVKRFIPLDERFRMRPEALEKAIEEDKKAGLFPLLIIANAGTTDTGAIDPLEAIGAIANKENIWYHIDGAYGAFFALTDEGKKKLSGMELSDSIVMDPHKGLFLPYGSGAVLVKDEQKLLKAHYYQANYMQDAKTDLLSPAELSPELTKHFRGMRMWLPLKMMGLKPFRACLEEKLMLTRYFYEQIKTFPDVEVGPEPELSVAFFRFVPEGVDAGEFNRKLVKKIHEDGRVFLSSTLIDGKFVIRLAVLSFRTHLNTIDLALEMLRGKIEELHLENAAHKNH